LESEGLETRGLGGGWQELRLEVEVRRGRRPKAGIQFFCRVAVSGQDRIGGRPGQEVQVQEIDENWIAGLWKIQEKGTAFIP
jgi:hypothetical protein